MGEIARSRKSRPRSVAGLGVVLIVIAGLAFLNVARGLTQGSLGAFLLVAPEQAVVPAVVGILSGTAAVGVFRGRRWGQILAIGVGAASLLGGVILLLPTFLEWGVPGSFALLLLPFALVAFLIGAYVLYVALANSAYFGRTRLE